MKKCLLLFLGIVLIGCGPVDPPSSSTPTTTPPATTTGGTVTGAARNIADTCATLAGGFTNTSPNVTEAWFEWGTAATYGNATQHLYFADLGDVKPAIDVSGLTAATTYHYRFVAKNANGTLYGDDKTFTTVTLAAKTTVVSQLTYPVQFAVDAANVYWTEGGTSGTVKKAPLAGGAAAALASSLADPYGIAVDSANVYWTEQAGGFVKTMPIGGCGAAAPPACPLTLAAALKNPQYIAVDATNVYFTEFGSWNTGAGARNADGTINKVPIAGGTAVRLAAALNGPQTIRADATNIYWTETANSINGAGSVKQVPIAGGAVKTLVSGLSGSQNIAADAADIYYWSGFGAMSRVAKDGGNAIEVFSGMTGTQPLIADSASVYWTESGYGGAVKKLDKATGNISVLASLGFSPCPSCNSQGIAVDATGIYWLESDLFNGATWTGAGAIKKMAK